MRFVITVLVSFLFSGSGLAQAFQDLRDPESGEPVPAGFAAPPEDYERPDRSGGFELVPIQHVAEGSTKLVRTHPNGVLFQNGAYLISGEILLTQPDTAFVEEFDRVMLPAQPADLVIRDNLAYVALRKDRGLLILDITNPEDVQEVGALEGEDLLAIAVDGDYAFVGRGTDGIGVYDISDPASPTLVHTSDTPGSANGIAVAGTTMYVADGDNAGGPDFRIYDISTPESPTLLGEFEAGGFVTFVVVAPGNNAIVLLAGDFGLKVVDVSDPFFPSEIGSLSLGGETTYEIAVRLSDSPIYVAGLAGLFSVDISDPTMPVVVQSYENVEQGLSVAIHEFHELALLGDRFEGLWITDASIPTGTELPQIGFYENAGFSHKAFFDGDELYVTDLSGRLRILDVTDVFAGVEEIARIDVPPNTQEVHVENGRAYVTDSDDGGTGLTILDVSDPTNPQIIGGWNSPSRAFGLDLVGNTLYVANDALGLVALDVSDPSNIQELGSFTMGITVDVVVDSARAVAYAVNYGDGMYSIDVSNPTNMQQLDAETDWGFLNAVSFGYEHHSGPDHDNVYVADALEGVRLVDVKNPTDLNTHSITPVRSLPNDVAAGTDFEGDVSAGAFSIADDSLGLLYYQTDGGGPRGEFSSADRGMGVAQVPEYFSDTVDLVVLASGETGVYFIYGTTFTSNEEVPAQNVLHFETPNPNPVRAATTLRYVLPEHSLVNLSVYDLLGRRIATLVDGVQTLGTHEVVFDASHLPSGVYILRFTAGGQIATTKVTVVL